MVLSTGEDDELLFAVMELLYMLDRSDSSNDAVYTAQSSVGPDNISGLLRRKKKKVPKN
jgi:hypothetical protein